jgi:predicted kinase
VAKLTITVGLPASGKSTWAEEERAADPHRVRVITRDDIRLAVGSVYEDGDEGVVMAVRDTAIRGYLRKGYHVICADTNLDSQTKRYLRSIADKESAEFALKDFTHVPLEVCLARNTTRHVLGDFKVPHEAIENMHSKFIHGKVRLDQEDRQP